MSEEDRALADSFNVEIGIKGPFSTSIPLFEQPPSFSVLIPKKQWWSSAAKFDAYIGDYKVEQDTDGYYYNATLNIVPGTYEDLSNQSLLARFLRWAYHIWMKVEHGAQ